MSGTTRVSRYQKGKTRKVKTNLDLLQQEIVSGSGICWAICKPAPHPRQPRQHPTTQFFTGQMPFLPPNQQCQSTEGRPVFYPHHHVYWHKIFTLPHNDKIKLHMFTYTWTVISTVQNDHNISWSDGNLFHKVVIQDSFGSTGVC